MPQPIDAAIRQQALDTRHSFAVSAPAGSGKTGLLTQRALALLAECEHPENLLAITFTRKAAAEMQQRILSALRQASEPEPPDLDDFAQTTRSLARKVLRRDQQQQWQLLTLPNRLRITTIDGFCRQLSQQAPLINGLGQVTDVLDAAEAQYAYQLAARNLLNTLNQSGQLQQDLTRLIRHLNNQLSRLETLFVQLLQRRDQWLGAIYSAKEQRSTLEHTLTLIIEDQLSRTHQHLLAYAGELLPLVHYAAEQLKRTGSDSPILDGSGINQLPGNTIHDRQHWDSLLELLLTKDGKLRKSVRATEGFPAASDKTLTKEEKATAKTHKARMTALLSELAANPTVAEELAAIKTLPTPTYDDEQWALLSSLTQVLPRLVAECQLVFQQLGKVDFIQITQSALQALGNDEQPTDLALLLDYRIQHILVDEFQDTSTPQRRLLQQLTAGWQNGDGRSLFVVGDAMQSCYGFRDANVGIFLDVRQQGLGDIQLTPLDLKVNFRSQKGLVDWYNNVFSALFPPHNNSNLGAVSYLMADSAKEETLTSPVITRILTHETTLPRSAEAEEVVSIIRTIHQQRPDDSIAILVRKRSQVPVITQALSSANITYRATDIERLETQMVIIDLLTLTRALLYPNDRIAWLALLRAPWCGLDMADLYTLANFQENDQRPTILSMVHQHRQKLSLSTTGAMLLERFAQAIELTFQQQGRKTLRQWVEGAWLELGGAALLTNPQEQQSIEAFWKILEQHQQGDTIGHWPTFVDGVKRLYADSPATDEAPRVDIMTIHKSKGLEFDTVIMPGLDLGSTSDPQELLLWQEWLDEQQQSQLIISPVHSSGADKDPIYSYIREQQRKKQQLEADRLFYVGCSRAIRQLYLLGCAVSEEQTVKIPNNQTPLAKIWPIIGENIAVIPVEKSEATADEAHPNALIRLPKHWQPIAPPVNTLLKNYRLTDFRHTTENDNRAKPDELRQRHKRYFGTVLHRALQQVADSGYQQWDDQRIQQQLPFWQRDFENLGVLSSDAKQQAMDVRRIIQQTISSPRGQWLLDNQHLESACEYALYHGQKCFVIDRTFIDRTTGERWIIDYKSSQPAQDQRLNDFLHSESQTYREQLESYRRLFQQKTNPIKLALYFPLLDQLYAIE